jgi:HEAT repeat protein
MISIVDVMNMKKQNDIEGLIRALEYRDDLAVRAEAAGSLGNLGDMRAVKPLILTLQQDNDPYVRSLAAKALGDLGDPSAEEVLMHCLGNDTLEVGLEAGKALSQLGMEKG